MLLHECVICNYKSNYRNVHYVIISDQNVIIHVSLYDNYVIFIRVQYVIISL